MTLQSKTYQNTSYFQKGESPKLLVLSGMHGDEHEVIQPVHTYVEVHVKDLPDFLFIPQVSPSAVAQKTRRNATNQDINRAFTEPTTDSEAAAIMNIVHPYQFDLCIDFHEDPDRTKGCYVYDSEKFGEKELTQLRKAIVSSGASLYTGIDDPADAHLGWHVRDGYVSMPLSQIPPGAGFSGHWFLSQGIVKRAFTVEVPGQAPMVLKRKLVIALFEALLPLIPQS
jgi:hypothetical protein